MLYFVQRCLNKREFFIRPLSQPSQSQPDVETIAKRPAPLPTLTPHTKPTLIVAQQSRPRHFDMIALPPRKTLPHTLPPRHKINPKPHHHPIHTPEANCAFLHSCSVNEYNVADEAFFKDRAPRLRRARQTDKGPRDHTSQARPLKTATRHAVTPSCFRQRRRRSRASSTPNRAVLQSTKHPAHTARTK